MVQNESILLGFLILYQPLFAHISCMPNEQEMLRTKRQGLVSGSRDVTFSSTKTDIEITKCTRAWR